MTNCPICGSKGDDLVFKFYCSNKDCTNYVANNKTEVENKDDFISIKVPIFNNQPNKNGDIFPFGLFNSVILDANSKIDFIKDMNFMKKVIITGFGIPEEYLCYSIGCHVSNYRIPKFHISTQEYYCETTFIWDEAKIIPEGFEEKIYPVMDKYQGYQNTPSNMRNMTSEIISLFKYLICSGELYFNNICKCWEYYPQR